MIAVSVCELPASVIRLRAEGGPTWERERRLEWTGKRGREGMRAEWGALVTRGEGRKSSTLQGIDVPGRLGGQVGPHQESPALSASVSH